MVDGYRVPMRADTFALLNVHRWPRLSLGFSLQYHSPISAEADLNLYVYPIPAERMALGEQAVVDAEFADAVRGVFDLQAAERAGMTVTIGSREAVTIALPGGQQVRGMRATGTLARGTDSRTTLVYVFAKGDQFFKYRISHSPRDAELLAPHLAAWLSATYAGVVDGSSR